MNDVISPIERIQRIAAKVLSTHPVGRGLCLVGGFRYRWLNASARVSNDLDYHWEGDLAAKQHELAEVFRSQLLPAVKRQLGYDGDVRLAIGPAADSPVVRTVELAFWRLTEPGSRIEIPVDVLALARLDQPAVRTVEDTVILTVSDTDMIESKILACLARPFFQVRDVLDIFLFQAALPPNAPARLAQKLAWLSLTPAQARAKLQGLARQRRGHLRSLEQLLDDQVTPTVAANLRAAGGAEMIWETVLGRLNQILGATPETSP